MIMARKKTSRSKSKPTTLAPRLADKRKGGSKKSKPRRTSPKVKSKPRSKATNATHPGGLAGWWESTSGETRQLIRGLVLGAIILAVLIGGGIWGFKAMEQRVLEKREGHGVTRQTVRFVNLPTCDLCRCPGLRRSGLLADGARCTDERSVDQTN